MNWSNCDEVEGIPEKVRGAPLVRGSRVPADIVLENYQSGESIEDIAYNFDLDASLISRVLAYAASHQSALHP
jgi:uncharacterized protein (DUF433 family)